MNLLVLNQYFPPDSAATAQLLGQWVEDLSRDHKVTVICGTPTYSPDRSNTDQFRNVRVLRIPLIPFSRANLLVRIVNYALYLAGSFFVSFLTQKKDLTICWTDPPLIGFIGALAAKFKGSKFLFVSQDVYPNVLVAAGKLHFWPIRKYLSLVIQFVYRSADRIVVIGEDMKKLLTAKGVPIYKLVTIRNWQDTSRLKPERSNSFRKENGISESTFLVMHSGNIGYSQDFGPLFSAAEELKGESDLQFVIVGDGAKRKSLQREHPLSNVKFLPYQPESKLSHSLSSADLHYVSLLPSFVGCIVPSKIYGIMAVGKPMLMVAPETSDIVQIGQMSRSAQICPSLGSEVSKTIVDLKNNRSKLDEMGKSGLNWVQANGTRDRAMGQYRALIQELI